MNPYHVHQSYQAQQLRLAPAVPPPLPPQHHQIHMAADPQRFPPYDPTPFQEVALTFATSLEKLEAHTSARFHQIEIALGSLSKTASEQLEMIKTTRQETKEAKEWFERIVGLADTSRRESKEGSDSLFNLVKQATRAVLVKSERIENILGDPDAAFSEDAKPTVLNRIEQLERVVLELSETVSDPDAARPSTVRHDVAVNTSPRLRSTADVGIDAVDLLLSPRLVEAGSSRLEVGVEARSSTPLRESTATQTVPIPCPEPPQEMPLPLSTSAYTGQRLAPASWSPRDDDTESTSGSLGRGPSVPPTPVGTSRASLVRALTTINRRGSSVYDEHEVAESLGDDMEDVRDRLSSPMPASRNMPPPARPLPPQPPVLLPRRHAVSPVPAVPSVPPAPSQASESNPPAPPLVDHTSRLSPPVPFRTGILAPSGTSPRRLSPARSIVHVPLPVASGSRSSSFISSAPSRPASPAQARDTPPREAAPPVPRSPPLSPLSSMSSSALSEVALSALSDVPSSILEVSSIQGDAADEVQEVQESVWRAGKGKASASAPVKVEMKRPAGRSAQRPAKRRKTLAEIPELDVGTSASASASATAATSASARRGRKKGNGTNKTGARAGVSSEGVKRKSQLVNKPVQEVVNVVIKQEKKEKKDEKKKYSPPQIGTDCQWPVKIHGAEHREFVQCDLCEGWYHFGCVGLLPDDPRLEPEAEFVCPPCESSPEICEQRRSIRFQAAACLRPDCDHPGAAEDTDEYFVERIIGRRPYEAMYDANVAQPTEFMWLVKWDGYKADEASWSANEHLGECSRIIEEFEQAAQIEGKNLDKHDEMVLLNEAAAAGWSDWRWK